MLKLYNSLTNKKEEFKPIEKNEVKMYSCEKSTQELVALSHRIVQLSKDFEERWSQKSQ